jgi:predicted dehydrogenase
MNAFKWGIIGTGQIAGEFAADCKHAGFKQHTIQAVLGHTLDKARAFAAKTNAPQYFDNLDAFLQQSDIDAVYVATPHTMHCTATIRCLARNIPVLCEKPMAINKRQVKEMVDAAAQHQTFLMEGMWIRFLPSIKKVLSLIDDNAIGKVLCVKADMSYRAPHEPGSRFFEPDKGGGSLLDLGIYPVYLAHLLLGKPNAIQAWARLTNKQVDEGCAALFSYTGGAYAVIESSLVIQTNWEAAIYGETGKIIIHRPWNEMPRVIELVRYDGKTTMHHCEWPGRGLQFEIDEVYNCIQQKKIESEHFCHHFSLDLIDTMDEIRKQTGIQYAEDVY